MQNSIVQLTSVNKVFGIGDSQTNALKNISFQIPKGSFAALAGSSGCGKTTCLNMIGGIDHPSSGDVLVQGQTISKLTDSEASEFRRYKLGFIFQSFNLLPVLSALENVEYPLLRHKNLNSKTIRSKAQQSLEEVGLGARLHHRPDQLSGGQKQRVAIARALVHKPELVLADEPTANLDRKTAHEIISLMLSLNQKYGITFLFSTHDPEVLKASNYQIHLVDGAVDRIIENQRVDT